MAGTVYGRRTTYVLFFDFFLRSCRGRTGKGTRPTVHTKPTQSRRCPPRIRQRQAIVNLHSLQPSAAVGQWASQPFRTPGKRSRSDRALPEFVALDSRTSDIASE